MNVSQLKKACLRLNGATENLNGPPSNVLSYSVGGKNFAYFKTSEPEQWRFNIRVSPDRFIELTDMPGVKPSRYMGRFHWVAIVDVSKFPADYLQELLEWSYRKAASGLTKAMQKELGLLTA
ncbi:MmcQ/YjbR family DNA-binding protein [Oxalobacteraceae bacterium]|nr:MmcQ/YjbR family DNA-binding protein [Oxalobacteraceae bacterium]